MSRLTFGIFDFDPETNELRRNELPVNLWKSMKFVTNGDELDSRTRGILNRYADGAISLMGEIRRVLKLGGRCVLVVGNSCLKDVFINNANCFVEAARKAGLRLERRTQREIPDSRRYLPVSEATALAKRMRFETVLRFVN